MIHLEHVALPDGLRALAYRDAHGNLVIYVSAGLDAACQRAAIMQAIRASRRNGWRAGLPPAGIAVLLGARTVLRQAVHVLKARPLAWGAAATATVVGASAAGVFLTTIPHRHTPSAAGPQPSAAPVPAPGQSSARPGRQVTARVAASPAAEQPASVGKPRPAPTTSAGGAPAPAPTPAAQPSPSPTPAPTQPAPSPSPSPLICVIVLGIKVCAPPVTVSP